MTALRPYFLLLGRASVVWLGAFALFSGALLVAGIADPKVQAKLHLDAILISTLWFPAAAGLLGGLVIQELQHTSFAHHLPGMRRRLAAGHLATGLVVALLLTGGVALSSSAPPAPALTFVLGLGAFCVGGALNDPLSRAMTATNTLLALFVLAMSRDLARLAGEHPWVAAAIALGIGAMAVGRLFARATFRRKPFRPHKPIPGRFSVEKTQRYERQRALEGRSRAADWSAGYLGGSTWAWVRAAMHETRGGMGWKDLLRGIGKLWALGLLMVLYTWADKGELSFGDAFGRMLYDTLFRSPHEGPLGGKGGPYLIVVIVIGAAGIVTALFNATALSDATSYPLSRLQRARVAFRAGLVDLALLLAVLGLGLFAVGHLTGLVVGYEARFDFMPFHFRVLMVTLVLIPLGHRGRLRLREAARRRAENTVVAVAFGVVGFVVGVAICVYTLPLILPSPVSELSALVAALVVSQLAYRQILTSYYRTADLA